MTGWFVVPRGWMSDFKPEPFTDREAYLWSIENAAYVPHSRWFNGRQFYLNRGELVTSVRHMAEAFTWPASRAKRFQDRMVAAEKWKQRPAYDGAQSPTVLTICRYGEIQSPADVGGTVEIIASETAVKQWRNSGETQDKQGNNGTREQSSKKNSQPVYQNLSRTRACAHAREDETPFDRVRP
ncbi:hypothetical protein [Sphingomonas sanxanigenens]|uniref:hypothetical protein n=1 Tax=Sphingomonas sanxanigenens TaxID=397260 RepID=UPI001300EC4D|nr:hypothetical protein [Sphingomonas sanxanigenens]